MHAALDDHLVRHLGRLDGELKRVAGEVRDAVEDLGRHVVVRQDHRVALGLELLDRTDVRGKARPIDLGDDPADPRIAVRRVLGGGH